MKATRKPARAAYAATGAGRAYQIATVTAFSVIQGDACPICGHAVRSGQQVVVLAVWDAFMPGYTRREKVMHADCVSVQARLRDSAPMLAGAP